MPKTFLIRDGLTPDSISLEKKKESVKVILSDFIKDAEKKSEHHAEYSDEELETESLAADRRHVNDMLPFEGTTEVAMKGIGDYGFFTAIYDCYNHHWGLGAIPDDWWYTIIQTVAIAIHRIKKKMK